jgi:hypothetical protein
VQNQTDELERVVALLPEHAAELEIDPYSVWRPSVQAVAAWRSCGGLMRIEVAVWSPAELIR